MLSTERGRLVVTRQPCAPPAPYPRRQFGPCSTSRRTSCWGEPDLPRVSSLRPIGR